VRHPDDDALGAGQADRDQRGQDHYEEWDTVISDPEAGLFIIASAGQHRRKFWLGSHSAVGEAFSFLAPRVLARRRGRRTETASRLRGRLEAVLSWATVAGHREGDNPARWRGNLSEMLAKPGKIARRGNHSALALIDVPRWWADLCERDGMAARALQFLTMCTARSGEVRGMTWAEVDFGSADDGTGATWTNRKSLPSAVRSSAMSMWK
jgi:hypothetical protein